MAENTTPTVYVICDQNCKFEGMTKEQILAAIMQAVNEGTISNIDAGFITKIKTVNNRTLRFFVGEQSQYDALSDEEKENLFAIITNDTTKEAIFEYLERLAAEIEAEKAAREALNKKTNKKLEILDKTTITTAADGSFEFSFEDGALYAVDVKVGERLPCLLIARGYFQEGAGVGAGVSGVFIGSSMCADNLHFLHLLTEWKFSEDYTKILGITHRIYEFDSYEGTHAPINTTATLTFSKIGNQA